LDKQSRVIQEITAESSRAQYDTATNEIRLTLLNAKITGLDDKNPEDVVSEMPNIGDFQETVEPIVLPLDQIFPHGPARQKLAWMNLGELKAQEARVAAQPVIAGQEKEHERDIMKVKMVIQDKFTMSVAVLSFALVGIPLGVRVSRKETSANLGLAVILFLSYYFLVVMVNWLDRHPEYRPDILYWGPNLIFLGIAFWLFRRADRA
jgi:lipopolysaccharide export system permease protein